MYHRQQNGKGFLGDVSGLERLAGAVGTRQGKQTNVGSVGAILGDRSREGD